MTVLLCSSSETVQRQIVALSVLDRFEDKQQDVWLDVLKILYVMLGSNETRTFG